MCVIVFAFILNTHFLNLFLLTHQVKTNTSSHSQYTATVTEFSLYLRISFMLRLEKQQFNAQRITFICFMFSLEFNVEFQVILSHTTAISTSI